MKLTCKKMSSKNWYWFKEFHNFNQKMSDKKLSLHQVKRWKSLQKKRDCYVTKTVDLLTNSKKAGLELMNLSFNQLSAINAVMPSNQNSLFSKTKTEPSEKSVINLKFKTKNYSVLAGSRSTRCFGFKRSKKIC